MSSRLKMALEELGLEMPEESLLADEGGQGDVLDELVTEQSVGGVEVVGEAIDEVMSMEAATMTLLNHLIKNPSSAGAIKVGFEAVLASHGYAAPKSVGLESAEMSVDLRTSMEAVVDHFAASIGTGFDAMFKSVGDALTRNDTFMKKATVISDEIAASVKSSTGGNRTFRIHEAYALEINGKTDIATILTGYRNLVELQTTIHKTTSTVLGKYVDSMIKASKDCASILRVLTLPSELSERLVHWIVESLNLSGTTIIPRGRRIGEAISAIGTLEFGKFNQIMKIINELYDDWAKATNEIVDAFNKKPISGDLRAIHGGDMSGGNTGRWIKFEIRQRKSVTSAVEEKTPTPAQMKEFAALIAEGAKYARSSLDAMTKETDMINNAVDKALSNADFMEARGVRQAGNRLKRALADVGVVSELKVANHLVSVTRSLIPMLRAAARAM